MKTEMMALVVEIQDSKSEENDFRFNETMVQAMMSGLSVVYTELFAWSVENHFAIWASGSSADLLIMTLRHHHVNIKDVQLIQGNTAEQFFDDVVTGKMWNDCSMLRKLDSFNNGFELSLEQDCLGPCLLPMLKKGKDMMSASPFINGAQYSWNYSQHPIDDDDAGFISKTIRIQSGDLFYRFSIN